MGAQVLSVCDSNIYSRVVMLGFFHRLNSELDVSSYFLVVNSNALYYY